MSDPIDLSYLDSRAAAYIERNPDGGSGLWLADDVLRLIAEVRRLRTLPVIATCGACSRLAHPHDRDWCTHRNAPDNAATNYEDPPPSWCPLRGPK